MILIEVNSVELVYDSQHEPLKVLEIPYWQVEKGEQIALFGPSGSGKSTFLNLLAGLLPVTKGRLFVCGHSLEKMNEAPRDKFRAQCIGYIFQNFNLLPGFSVVENVLLGMTFSARRADLKEAKLLLDQVGLAHRLRYYPAQLSMGEQQRVAVARALANRPQLLLADEPTGSLDPINKKKILQLIRSISQIYGCTLILVSHEEDVLDFFEKALPFSSLNKAFQVQSEIGE